MLRIFVLSHKLEMEKAQKRRKFSGKFFSYIDQFWEGVIDRDECKGFSV